jgi:hypothetical protein
MALLRLSREQFFGLDGSDGYFDYHEGEHAAAIGPTGNGKSWLMWQALAAALEQNPQVQPVVLMPKPRDPTTALWAPKLGLRETPVWPPQRKLLQAKPRGHVVWPPHAMDLPPDERRQRVGDVLRLALDAQYRRGHSITFLDDAHSAAVMMNLNSYVEELLVNGRAGGAGGWVALQKPSGSLATGSISSFVYSSATHLFLTRDNDDRNVKRFGEIAGFDPKETHEIVKNLRLFRIGKHTVSEVLYIDLRGPYRCLVGP